MDPLVFAIWSSLIVVGGGGFVLWLTWPEEDGLTPWQRWRGGRRSYVEPLEEGDEDEADVLENPAFERPERPQNVQGVQPPNDGGLSAEDITKIDAAARMVAAGVAGEAAAIELLFDGVKRGGSKRYVALRDGVRIVAARYGWKPPEAVAPASTPEPRRIPINEGKAGYIEV